MAVQHHLKKSVQSHGNKEKVWNTPRSPKPVDMPPNKLRTSHVRSKISSSKRCQKGLSSGILYTYVDGGMFLCTCGPQTDKTARSMNFVNEE